MPSTSCEFSWSHGQRALWEAVPADERDGAPRADLDALAGMRDDAGGITLGQQVRYTLGVRA